MLLRVAAFLLSFLVCPALCAEQNFYQTVDPDGRVRVIQLPKDVSTPKRQVKQSLPTVVDKAPDVPMEEQRKTVREGSDSVRKTAPYNGETYLDSEYLDSTRFNPEQKSKFYIVNDGLRSRVEEDAAVSSDTIGLDFTQSGHALKAPAFDMPSEREEFSDDSQMKGLLASNSLCLSASDLGKSESLLKGRLRTVIIDEKALRYRNALSVVALYKLYDTKVSLLTLRSYAKSEAPPAFVSPLLAMTDRNGCITRIVSGYFQSRYEATKAKHSMLEGAVTIHPDEAYLFVIAPDYQRSISTSYKQSKYGQLSIKWQP